MKLISASQLTFALLLLLLPPQDYAQPAALLLLAAATVGLMLAGASKLRSWLIILALLLTIAPGLDCALVLVLRRIGIHAYLTGAPFSVETQTNALLYPAAVLTFAFVLALCAGWLMLQKPSTGRERSTQRITLSIPCRWALVVLWSLCAFSFFQTVGGATILSVQYGQGVDRSLIYSGAYAVIANIALLFLDLSTWGQCHRNLTAAFWGVECTALILLGNRVDVLFALLALLVIRVPTFRAQTRAMLLGVIVIVPLFTFWGFYRQLAAFDLHKGGEISYATSTSLTNLPTLGGIGPASLTTTDSIYLYRTGRLNLLHGMGYLNYIPRTLPIAVDPARPPSIADLFSTYGLPTIGGLTPVAEALVNFGPWGLPIVGLLLGLLLAWLERMTRNSPSDWIRASYYVMVAMSFRTWLYEVFSLYKGLVVFSIFALSIWAINRISSPNQVPALRPAPAIKAPGA